MNGSDPVSFRKVPLFRFEQCREMDRITISKGIPEVQLMGQAALASLVYLILQRTLPGTHGERGSIHILCGTGNNGGDGLALALHLLGLKNFGESAGERLYVYRVAPARTEAARFYEALLLEMGIALHPVETFPIRASSVDLIIEALLGTGQSGPLRGEIRDLLLTIGGIKREYSSVGLISLDVPAGVSEEGSIYGDEPFHPPDEIHVYGAEKACLHMHPELKRSKIVRLPIGFHPYDREPYAYSLPTPASSDYYMRSPYGHKYEAGDGLLIGGFPGMEGAAVLSAEAFFASGGGIVHHAAPGEISGRLMLQRLPSALTLRLDDPALLEQRPGAVAIGPGLCRADLDRNAEGLLRLIAHYYATGLNPCLILDAAACHLVLESGFPDAARFRTLLTPHAGEWRSLGAPAIQSTDDLEPASEFVQNRLGASVYHKGAVSVLFHHTPERSVQLYIRNNPSAALSVAGSGDVLTGILLALFSRKDSTHEGYTRTIPNIVGAAVDLLLNSVMGSIHPRSDQFPELIRSHLLSGGTELK